MISVRTTHFNADLTSAVVLTPSSPFRPLYPIIIIIIAECRHMTAVHGNHSLCAIHRYGSICPLCTLLVSSRVYGS